MKSKECFSWTLRVHALFGLYQDPPEQACFGCVLSVPREVTLSPSTFCLCKEENVGDSLPLAHQLVAHGHPRLSYYKICCVCLHSPRVAHDYYKVVMVLKTILTPFLKTAAGPGPNSGQ